MIINVYKTLLVSSMVVKINCLIFGYVNVKPCKIVTHIAYIDKSSHSICRF